MRFFVVLGRELVADFLPVLGVARVSLFAVAPTARLPAGLRSGLAEFAVLGLDLLGFDLLGLDLLGLGLVGLGLGSPPITAPATFSRFTRMVNSPDLGARTAATGLFLRGARGSVALASTAVERLADLDVDDFVLLGDAFADRDEDVGRDEELGRGARGVDDVERALFLKPDLVAERLPSVAASESSPSGFSRSCTGTAAAA